MEKNQARSQIRSNNNGTKIQTDIGTKDLTKKHKIKQNRYKRLKKKWHKISNKMA